MTFLPCLALLGLIFGVIAPVQISRRVSGVKPLAPAPVSDLVRGIAGPDGERVKNTAAIPRSLPPFSPPTLGTAPELVSGALAIALVALAQEPGAPLEAVDVPERTTGSEVMSDQDISPLRRPCDRSVTLPPETGAKSQVRDFLRCAGTPRQRSVPHGARFVPH
ncbi:hypothetical protein [Streptomyces sp. YPW6]|uniref:hypothetical protein n=1 Tax=Streptomyces sp. YPW6 TaxID=2840373 RepID=UPI003EB7BEB6